jgi:RNA polymerase sigma-70 factor (ECF subfamily)
MPTPSSSEPWIESGHEAGLLLAAQRGGRESFFELLRAHQRPLYAVCFALTRRREDAARLLQETARLAWRGLQQHPVGKPFFPYLLRIVRNLAVAHARRRQDERRPSPRPAPIPAAHGDMSPHLPSVDELELLTAFADLTEDEQVLFALRLIEGLGYAQLGQMMGVAPGAVMHRLQAIRGKLETAREAA